MTRQVTEGQPITIVARSQVGGFIPDAPVTTDADVYSDVDCTQRHDELRTNGAGEFVFYAPAGSVVTVTVDDPIATDVEPVQVVGVASRPGGVAAVQPDQTPEVHESSPVSEQVSDASLVGAPSSALPESEGGAAAMVGADTAQNVPPEADTTQSPATPQEAIDAQVASFPQDETVEPQTEAVSPATDPNAPAPEVSAGTSGIE